MHATKETCIIAYGAMALALFLAQMLDRRGLALIKPWHAVSLFLAALAISILLHSSFFSHPRGIIDSFLTYKTYFSKASQDGWHVHPWSFYLGLLLFVKPFWSEAIVLLLAGAGFWTAFRPRRLTAVDPLLLRFIACYTLLMTLIYSFIPYKTPWSLLGFYHGMIILAAIGFCAHLPTIRRKFVRPMIILCFGHLILQSCLSNQF
jgi:hypothetical protein